MKIAQLFILILAFLIIRPADAGILVEPVLGYSAGKFTNDDLDIDEKGAGPSIGGRVGYQNLGFQLGLDYLRSNISVDDSDYKDDMVMNELGAFVGFEFPVMFRVYAGYIISSTAETVFNDGSGKTDLEFSEGNGMKLGLGLTALPFVDINFEYRKGNYGELETDGTKTGFESDYNVYMIGLSLPFVL